MVQDAGNFIKIDRNQSKLQLHLNKEAELTVHFDSPSRRFYLSVKRSYQRWIWGMQNLLVSLVCQLFGKSICNTILKQFDRNSVRDSNILFAAVFQMNPLRTIFSRTFASKFIQKSKPSKTKHKSSDGFIRLPEIPLSITIEHEKSNPIFRKTSRFLKRRRKI